MRRLGNRVDLEPGRNLYEVMALQPVATHDEMRVLRCVCTACACRSPGVIVSPIRALERVRIIQKFSSRFPGSANVTSNERNRPIFLAIGEITRLSRR